MSAIGPADDDKIVLVDLWSAMMDAAGWKPEAPLIGSKDVPDNAFLHSWLSDGRPTCRTNSNTYCSHGYCLTDPHNLGLHFMPPGYRFLFDTVMDAIKLKWPDQLPPEVPFVLPSWEEAPKA